MNATQAANTLREQYDRYAENFITDGMVPMDFAGWFEAQVKDREMADRYTSVRR